MLPVEFSQGRLVGCAGCGCDLDLPVPDIGDLGIGVQVVFYGAPLSRVAEGQVCVGSGDDLEMRLCAIPEPLSDLEDEGVMDGILDEC